MNAAKRPSLKVVVLLAVVGLVSSYVIGAAPAAMNEHPGHKAKTAKTAVVSLDVIHAQQLPAIEAAVQKAIRLIEAGRAPAALVELRRAQSALTTTRQALGQHIKPKFVNNQCPIMGSPINAEKVAASLVRNYQGQRVAFCCAGCPAAWDQLSDADKAAKLKKASRETQHEQR
jgi:hypothetical protein